MYNFINFGSFLIILFLLAQEFCSGNTVVSRESEGGGLFKTSAQMLIEKRSNLAKGLAALGSTALAGGLLASKVNGPPKHAHKEVQGGDLMEEYVKDPWKFYLDEARKSTFVRQSELIKFRTYVKNGHKDEIIGNMAETEKIDSEIKKVEQQLAKGFLRNENAKVRKEIATFIVSPSKLTLELAEQGRMGSVPTREFTLFDKLAKYNGEIKEFINDHVDPKAGPSQDIGLKTLIQVDGPKSVKKDN